MLNGMTKVMGVLSLGDISRTVRLNNKALLSLTYEETQEEQSGPCADDKISTNRRTSAPWDSSR